MSILSLGDTLFGGLVSNLQVAELLAFMAKNPDLSYCKVVEVVAETTAPLTPMGDLLTKIPPQRAIPYQPKEPEVIKEPEPVSESTISKSSSIATETQSQSKAASTRPLSPYTTYEGLKPPSSPIPTPPGGSKTVVEAISAPPTDPDTSTKPETIASTTEAAPVTAGLQKTRPLSPYTAYESLKPPSSPTPTPSGSKQTPSYTSSTPEAESTTAVDTTAMIDVGSEVKEEPPQNLTSSNSPYNAYENLKPPASPSPSTPSVSQPPTALVDNGSPIAPTPEDTSAPSTVKPRALSPYPMYENLKPPSSPTPSTPQ